MAENLWMFSEFQGEYLFYRSTLKYGLYLEKLYFSAGDLTAQGKSRLGARVAWDLWWWQLQKSDDADRQSSCETISAKTG